MTINIANLKKAYGDQIIFDDFSQAIETNRITGITGPSGAGKTTLLRLLSGLEKADGGTITGVEKNNLSFIFQEPRLLPWLTVRQNLRFVMNQLNVKRTGPFEDEIDQMLSQVELTSAKDLYPQALSGGMKQRVSIARAFLVPSSLLIMDEPFVNLDAELKDRLMELFLSLWEKSKKTVIFVSHDNIEIRKLSDIILTLSENPVRVLKSEENIKL
ncbi:ABC transporter ATP-binding protein [Eubacteriaceae bacterium ES3]|nr:ABC transporter ATP-binding protein [Eubacteriaceae bacterium ES3]